MSSNAIFGIGNLLLGDDGVGPAVIRYLQEEFTFPDSVTIEDLGTPSLDLPNYLAGHDTVIFVDAVAGTGAPGTIRRYTREEIVAAPTGIRISPHEPTINDALQVLDFAGGAPRDVVLIGVVPDTLNGGIALSDSVARAVPVAGDAVIRELMGRGVKGERRKA